MSDIAVMKSNSVLSDFPEHAAVLAIIDRYTFIVDSRISVDTLTGITSYLDGWGPEGCKFNPTGLSLAAVISDVLVDLENIGLVLREDSTGMYHLSTDGIRYMEREEFFKQENYLSDIVTLIVWYAKSFRGPVLYLRDRSKYGTV